MIKGFEARALMLCEALDREHAAGPADEDADRLHVIGELLGGLSCRGFVNDLLMHLQRVDDDVRDEAPAGMRTESAAADAREAAAADFLFDATVLLNERMRIAA